MPGIFTHNIIFRKTLEKARKQIKNGPLYKSIESFFSSENHLKSGLFGSIGPNLFNYMEYRSDKNSYGNRISYYLHNNGHLTFTEKMIEIIYEGRDIRSEWSSEQKAYLMGYVSHLIADTMIHPYVFFNSGIPNIKTGKSGASIREKNLLFQYNIDNYYLFKDEETSQWKINIEDMFFITGGKKPVMQNSIKVLILKALSKDNHELFESQFKKLKDVEIDGDIGQVPSLDKIHEKISLAYRIKREKEGMAYKFSTQLRDMNILKSDFTVEYPPVKRADIDAINLHKGRWQFPCIDKKLRYESVPQLLNSAVDITLEAWLEIESIFFGNENIDLKEFLKLNPYTGLEGHSFEEMDTSEPVKLKF